MNIILPSVLMKSEPKNTSRLETECLFGESVDLLDEKSGWALCKLLTDNYQGWVKKNTLGVYDKTSHRVISVRSYIFEKNDVKSNIIHYLPMGALLTVKRSIDEWYEVKLANFYNKKIGYVPKAHLVQKNHKYKDWVKYAEQLINIPYKWGGRDTLGIDCSALLQLSYQTFGQNIPRNTSQQIKLKKKEIVNISDLKRGCVIFWQGHVGIMINSYDCIHANAHHMKTIIEPLTNITKRIKNTSSVLKMMNFN